MEEQKIYLVGGIAFTDIKQAKIAQIEKKRIEVLDEKLNYNDMEAVANVYKKARDNRTFQTPVGINYMMRLYHWLKNNNYEGIDKMYVVMDMETAKTVTDPQDNDEHTERDNIWKSRLQAEKHKRKEVVEKLRLSLVANADNLIRFNVEGSTLDRKPLITVIIIELGHKGNLHGFIGGVRRTRGSHMSATIRRRSAGTQGNCHRKNKQNRKNLFHFIYLRMS